MPHMATDLRIIKHLDDKLTIPDQSDLEILRMPSTLRFALYLR
jgi:hypothetical protein